MTAFALLSGGFLAGCSDDDEPEVKVPESFTVSANSANVMWDDTEAVIDFGANVKWDAVSSAAWVQIDPNKGDAGDHRLFLVMTRNYNLLPRTATVSLKCGEQTQQITVTQSGCDDPTKVTTVNTSLETGTTDNSAGELALSGYSYEIENNLGLTIEQFKQGVADGTVELCMVNRKENSWSSADYTANEPGYWLDSDLEVTHWDGAGYPANALFIEVSEDVVYIGRAPGITTELNFEMSFVLRLAKDHSKYLRFNVNVTCPIYTPEVTVEAEGNVVEATIEMVDVYNATVLPFEQLLDVLSESLSVESAEAFVGGIENGDIFMYMVDPATGEWLTEAGQTAGGYMGYWLGENLTPTGWSPDGYPSNTIFIETHDEGIGIGAAPGVESGMEFNVSFVYAKSAQKFIRINLHAYEH